MIQFLTNANTTTDRRCSGLSNLEIANGLKKLAVNDNNKKMVSVKNFRSINCF